MIDFYPEAVTDQRIASTYALFAEAAGDPDFEPPDGGNDSTANQFAYVLEDHAGDLPQTRKDESPRLVLFWLRLIWMFRAVSFKQTKSSFAATVL